MTARIPNFWWADHSATTRQAASLFLQTPQLGNGIRTKPWVFGDPDRSLLLYGGIQAPEFDGLPVIDFWLHEQTAEFDGQPMICVDIQFQFMNRGLRMRPLWDTARRPMCLFDQPLDTFAADLLVLVDQLQRDGWGLDWGAQ